MDEHSPVYEVDEAMMGQDWAGGPVGLVEFCEVLQGLIGPQVRIVHITGSCNGAHNGPETLVPDSCWCAALMRHARKNPKCWK